MRRLLFKKIFYLFSFLFIFLLFKSHLALASENFKFHLISEPKSLDPAQVSLGDGAGYFYQNIYQGLFVYHQKKLIPLGAKFCRKSHLTVICELNPQFKWSDGKVVEASEYVAAFRHLLGFKSKNPIIRILKNVKNAAQIFSGQLGDETLGVKAINRHQLRFQFESDDPDFLYKLTSPLTAPIRNNEFATEENAANLIVTGPYKIESWTKGKRILLIENINYIFFQKDKPKVEIFFVDDDQTALLLYEAHKINFLKTLPTALVSEYKMRPDFLQVPMARFDYLGFSPKLKDIPKLREALALSLDYEQLKKMFSALGVPGCSSLPDDYLSEPVCVHFDLERAKKIFSELPKEVREKSYHLAFSSYDRDDVLRGMQWAAEQWRIHLGLKIEIEKLESGVFNDIIKTDVPDIFRKSVMVDRPTCLAAIENFGSKGSEAFLKLDSPTLENTILKMNAAKSPKLCTEALTELIGQHELIGLGKIHFTMLMSPRFTGWEINELNGLDLSRLKYDPLRPETP